MDTTHCDTTQWKQMSHFTTWVNLQKYPYTPNVYTPAFFFFFPTLWVIVSCHVSQPQSHAFLPEMLYELWLPNLTSKIQLSQFSYSYPEPQFLIQIHRDSQEKKLKIPFFKIISTCLKEELPICYTTMA